MEALSPHYFDGIGKVWIMDEWDTWKETLTRDHETLTVQIITYAYDLQTLKPKSSQSLLIDNNTPIIQQQQQKPRRRRSSL